MHWVVFEDGHVAEYTSPPVVERAAGARISSRCCARARLDAAIYGADLPDDPTLQSVIPDPDAAAMKWYAQHGVVPINHMVVVTEKVAKTNPEAVKEIYRVLLQAKTVAGLSKGGGTPGEIDFLPFGVAACRPALETIINYAWQQNLIPRKIEVAELFDGTTRALERRIDSDRILHPIYRRPRGNDFSDAGDGSGKFVYRIGAACADPRLFPAGDRPIDFARMSRFILASEAAHQEPPGGKKSGNTTSVTQQENALAQLGGESPLPI